MRCVPVSATQTAMEYDVFRHVDATDADFEKIDSMFKRVLGEDKWLCNNAQKNLEAGVFVNGQMHPRMEKGPLFFQETVRSLLYEHRKQEAKAGKQIWPARQRLGGGGDAETEAEIEFCSGLSSCSGSKPEMEW